MIGSDASSKLVLLVLSKCKSCHKRSPSLIKLGHTAVGHYDEYSISSIINELEWNSLETRRNHAKLNMAYKIINGHVILSSDSLPKASFSRISRSCNEVRVGSANQLMEPQSRLLNNKTFFYSVPRLWNNTVTSAQAGAPSVDAFKNYFRRK